MKIKNLKIHNILSIEDAEIEFGNSGLVLIEGFDYDTSRANGAGKSAIFNALSFALYDEVPKKITKSEILRRGMSSGYSEVTLDVMGREIKIRRDRPVACTYSIDGSQVEMTQEAFIKMIGLNYNQFLTTMYNCQDSNNRFVFLNDRGKKEFLLDIMNLGNFNDFKKNVTDRISKLNLEYEITKTKVEGFRNSINIYKQQLINPKDIQVTIDQLNFDTTTYLTKIKELELISEPDITKYFDIEKNIQNKTLEIQSFKMQIQSKRAELKKLQDMTHDTECPDCSTHLNIINGKAYKANNQGAIDTQIKAVSAQINELETGTLRENEIRQLADKVKLKKAEDYKEYNTAQNAISEYKNSITYKTREINTLSAQVQKNDETKTNMRDVIYKTTVANDRLKQIVGDKEILETIGMFFDPTGAPAYIMDGIVDSFNDSVTDYINHIWPNASYSLQTFKENKDKTLSTKFSESLMINGKETSIGSLSGGELRALSLAIDFAVVDILKNKFSTDLNPIILDEPFNGLDTSGKEMVIELLEKLATDKEIWIVDHSSESKSMFDRIVRVEKRNGISVILNE
jgi:DNA repair exonuclease SbcCD ATPase subunit